MPALTARLPLAIRQDSRRLYLNEQNRQAVAFFRLSVAADANCKLSLRLVPAASTTPRRTPFHMLGSAIAAATDDKAPAAASLKWALV